MTEYKVEACYKNAEGTFVEVNVWVESETHLDACSQVMIDHLGTEWFNPVLSVDRDYNIGCYTADQVRLNTDYMVGLREPPN